MRRLFLAALIGAIAVAGCVKPRPKTGPQAPSPLDVPAAPPRVIALPELEEPPEDTTPSEPEPAKEKPRKPSSRVLPRDRPDAAKPAETKPDTPPVEAPKPPAAPPPAPLQPALPASTSTQELQKQVEAQLGQATADLRKVDQARLTADAKAQYQSAQQFVTQARAALKEGNLVFAQKLAEKAVGLASNLVPR